MPSRSEYRRAIEKISELDVETTILLARKGIKPRYFLHDPVSAALYTHQGNIRQTRIW